MMQACPALRVAVDLFHVPSQVRRLRSEALPEEVSTLLRIAAGDETALAQACEMTGREPNLIRTAAAFYIEQILLAPNADSYQILGGDRSSSASELRRNMALLLRWLHPDKDPLGERSMFAARVTAAWETLKTPERRAAYDAAVAPRERKVRSGRSRKPKFLGAGHYPVGSVADSPNWHVRTPGLLQRTLWALRRVLS